ncbi:MAG: DUF433 domain-containing protein [bacterium]
MERSSEPLINIDAEILGGQPVFMGTRVPVRSLPDCSRLGILWMTSRP